MQLSEILLQFNLSNFYVLLSSSIFFILLFFVGRSVSGPKEIQAIQIPIGLFVVYIFFIIGSLLIDKFSTLNVIVFLVVFFTIGVLRSLKVITKDLLVLSYTFILILPLLIIASRSHPYLWDEYTNWLPPAQYLYKYKHLPTFNEPIVNNVTSSYSYLRALMHSIINYPFSSFIMNIQGVINIFIGGSLLLWSKPILRIFNNNKNKSNLSIFYTMGLLCFLLIIWFISLDYVLVFSSYSEASYLIIFTHLYLYLILIENPNNKLRDGKFNWILSILFATPLLIKEIGLHHSLIIFISYWLVFLLPHIIKNQLILNLKTIFIQFLHLIPMFITQILWSIYRSSNELTGAMRNILINNEKIELIPNMISSAKKQFINEDYLIVSIIIIILIFIFEKPNKNLHFINIKLFIFGFLIFIGITLLTLLAYILAFSSYEAENAASFGRYLAPTGFVLWSSVIIGLININYNINFKVISTLGMVVILIYLLFTFFMINKINFDRNIDYEYQEIAKNIINNYPENENLLIIDLNSNGKDSIKIRYYLNGYMPASYYSYIQLALDGGVLNEDIIKNWFENYKSVHIHSASTDQLNLIKNFWKAKQ